MPQGSTYLDELALLNQQNFLGGVAVFGKAIKEKEQNETLVNLYNKFKADKNKLQTTLEQQGDFNKYLSSVDMKEDSKLSPEADMFVNFMKTADQYGAYVNLYQPFITAFATLGDEGVKIASTLSDELANQLFALNKKEESLFKAIEFKRLVQDYAWTKEKWQSWSQDEALKRDSLKAADYIMNSNAFDLIEGGEVITASSKKLDKYNAALQAIIDDASSHFGDSISKSAILAGLHIAMVNTGKSFKFDDRSLLATNLKAGMKLPPFDINSYTNNLRNWSQMLSSASPQLKQAFIDYATKGVLPDVESSKRGLDATPERVKELYEIFKPDGKYIETLTYLNAATNGEFSKVKDVDLGQGVIVPFPLNGYPDIILPYGSTGFINRQYNFNPDVYTKALQIVNDRKKSITEGSLYSLPTEQEVAPVGWYDFIINEEMNKKLPEDFLRRDTTLTADELEKIFRY